MAAKSPFLDNSLLALIYNATATATLWQNNASSPITNIFVALHTADPSAGNQSTNEVTYTGYARVSVARTTGGWVVTAASVSPAATITFPTGTGGSGTATFFSTGVASSGATNILHYGPISPSIVTGAGITPALSTATVITES